MSNQNVSVLDMGASHQLDPKTRYIKFEGDNSQFFWRVCGDILNSEAEIIIPETHQAIYVKDGVMQEVLEGGRYPIFDVQKGGFLGLGKKRCHATVDIIFVSKTCQVKVLWGTRTPIKLRDDVTEIPVTVRANGEFTIQIHNPKQFYLTTVGSDKNFNIDALKQRCAGRMMSFIEPVIAKFMHDNKITYVDISQNKKIMSESILPEVSKMFIEEFGLKSSTFTIYNIEIAEEEIQAIEDELQRRKDEIKNEKDAKELAAELERLADKEWEREVYLRQLEQADKFKYYEVLTILGWPNGSPVKGGTGRGGQFCPNCGEPYKPNDKFCCGCGKPLPGGKRKCPQCGKELDGEAKFCSGCGQKMF